MSFREVYHSNMAYAIFCQLYSLYFVDIIVNLS